VRLGRLAQASRPGPFWRRFGPPFLEYEEDATLSTCGCCNLRRERERGREREVVHKLESWEETDHLREGSIESKEAATSGGGR
jgi:hypothetical protein